MLIRVVARVPDLNEDLILQNIEPKLEFVWAVKYIRYDTIETFQALEKNKTVIFPYDGIPIIIKENVDKFYERLTEEMKKADAKESQEVESTYEDEEEQEEEDEDQK